MENEDIFSVEQEEEFDAESTAKVEYSEDDIKTLDWKEHIRRRPGMYIGKLGDGSNFDDGIYVLIKRCSTMRLTST